MPNFCENTLKIKGHSEDVKRFILTAVPVKTRLPGYLNVIGNLIPVPSTIKAENAAVWRQNNWGMDSDVVAIACNAPAGVLVFDSSWKPPIKALSLISQKYPELKFHMEYEELANGIAGEAWFDNGR